jgi:hypothetical protein
MQRPHRKFETRHGWSQSSASATLGAPENAGGAARENQSTEITTMTTAVKTDPQQHMEQKIADLLTSPDGVSAETFATTLRWVDAKIVLTKRDAQEALKASLDPATIDPGGLGRAHDAEHFLKRLENAKTGLTTHCEAATRREQKAAWEASIVDLEKRVVDLSQELRAVYPEAITKLVDLFRRIDVVDKEVAMTNCSAPDGCRQLRSVEAAATGSTRKIIPTIRLPVLSVDGSTVADAWPPLQPSPGIELSNMVLAAARGAMGLPLTDAEREARAVAETEKQMEFYRQREAGRERLNAEAAARAERQAAERRAAGG